MGKRRAAASRERVPATSPARRLAPLLAGLTGVATATTVGGEVVTDRLAAIEIPALADVIGRVQGAIDAHPALFLGSYGTLCALVFGLETVRARAIRHAPTATQAAWRRRWLPHPGMVVMSSALGIAGMEMVQAGFNPAHPEFQHAYGDALLAGAFIALMTGIDRAIERALPGGCGHHHEHAFSSDHTPTRWLHLARTAALCVCLIDDAAWPMLTALRWGMF
ncbi:MAG: hypothetical protein HY696_00105 [Deltaproteobacteria bacterium]|nr:hypothetical protein [Deltaproteobacteria bacterium]